MIHGLVRAEITGADISRTIDILTEQGVTVLRTAFISELTAELSVQHQDFEILQKICIKRGDSLRIMSRNGLYWNIRYLAGRPVLLFGFAVLFFLTLYLPSRVLFVKVEGNESIPERKILEMAEQCGIRFGASRRRVRSEQMKNTLLEAVPQLQWAGVNTRGTVAVISVRERQTEKRNEESSGFGHIVAGSDSVIISCTATRGNLLCIPGQAVRAGQVLISGYTDTGLVIRMEQAEGEILGRTLRKMDAVTPSISCNVIKTGDAKKKISVIIGKKRINLWKDSGIWDATCDRMYEEYCITLPGGYRLPLAIAVERFTVTQWIRREISSAEAETLLSGFSQIYLKQTMVAGRILSSSCCIDSATDIWILTGEYHCSEMIGTLMRQQIGE